MGEVMANLASSAGGIEHPLLESREERNVAFVVIGADRGLAGSYNVNVMHRAISAIGDRSLEGVKLVLVGKKAVGFFKRRPYETVATLDVPGSEVTFNDVRRLTSQIRSMFESGEVDAVYLVYARFVTAMRQEPTVARLLPMERSVAGEAALSEFEFEPEAGKLLGALLPRYVDTQVYQSLVEAQASEQGARMTAMSSATKNAGEMIDTLTLAYNKARQAAITKELTEIVSGAEALR
jgi:F-type H+-transporting ATPase subunit gamma